MCYLSCYLSPLAATKILYHCHMVDTNTYLGFPLSCLFLPYLRFENDVISPPTCFVGVVSFLLFVMIVDDDGEDDDDFNGRQKRR